MRYLQYVKTDDTGRCWWDTGIIPDLNTKVELSIRPTVQTSVSSSYCCQGYLGSQRGDDTPDSFQVRLYGWDWQGLWFRIGTTQVDYQPHSELFDTWINITLDKDNYTVNGNSYSVGASYMEENVRSLYIGGINNPNWSHKRAAFGTMFGEVKIWKSGVLVFDGKPAEDNGALGFYDEVSQTFKQNLGTGVPVAGPDAVSIYATPSKTKLASTGETISIEVATDNAWTLSTSGGSFLTFSSTGDTSGATITATAPDYSGSTPREEYLTFVDSVTGDYSNVTITQKKYQSGQPFYLGGDEVTECYVGGSAVVEAYLGEDLVYSSGPFQGLKINPKTFTFTPSVTSATLTVKSSEAWTATTPSWITASPSTGVAGEIAITLTSTPQTAYTSDVIEIDSTNFSASASCVYDPAEYVEMANIYEPNVSSFQLAHRLDTGIAHTASTMEIEIEFEGRGGSFSDRMIGYAPNDPGCTDDDNDFRVFGWQGGAFDYMTYRSTFGGDITIGSHHFRIGDCYCYDYDLGNYRCQGSTVGSVPSPNCHIYVDVSRIKVKSVKITDGNSTLFDGVAAEKDGVYGLWDKVGNQMITNSDITITGTPITE